MVVEFQNGSWRVKGNGCERARLAYAELADGKLVYKLAV